MTADFSEVRNLAREFGKATSGILDEVDKVAKKAAQNIKEDYQKQASSSFWFKGISGSFSYDEMPSLRGVKYEIGPDKSRRGGALGNIFFFGGSHGGGGSGDLEGPLEDEAPRFEKALGEIGVDRISGQ